MKIHHRFPVGFVSPQSLAVLLGLAMLAGTVRAAEPAPAPVATPETPFMLFIGTDVAIEWKGQFRPLVGVKGSEFVVNLDGKPTVVPTAETKIRIKVADNLRMSDSVASVANVKTERTYTPGSDPGRKLVQSVSMAMSGNEATTRARSEARYNRASSGSQMPSGGSPGQAAAAAAAAEAAQQEASASQGDYFQSMGAGANISDVGSRAAMNARDLAENGFDAIRVTFEISSPRPLTAPYLVVLARLREDPKRPNALRQLVYAQNLPPIDTNQRTIEVYRGGLPPGYELEDCQIHLFDSGREVATSVSRKQVPLGLKDAFQFAIADYVTRHKNETQPPAPAQRFWSEDLSARLQAHPATSTIYVKIAKSGATEGAFEDRACTRRIADEVLAATIAELRFYPALEKGVPIGGVAILRPAVPAS